MAIKYVIAVSGADSDNPIKSDDKFGNVQRLSQIFRSLAGGHKPVTYSVDVRTSAAVATATVTCAAVEAADTVTISGVVLTATQHNATGTVTVVVANTDADDTITIGDAVFTAAAAEDTELGEFDISGTDEEAGDSLAACIEAAVAGTGVDAHENPLFGLVQVVSSAAGVVTLRAVNAGVAGNDIGLVTSDADGLVVSDTTLTGGAAVANAQFDYTGTNAQTATALAAAINAHTTAGIIGVVSAEATNAAVLVSAQQPGVSGNAIQIKSSNGTRLAVSGTATRDSLTFLTGGAGTKHTMSF